MSAAVPAEVRDGTPVADLAWDTAYLLEQLAAHPPTGYNTGPWPGTPVHASSQGARGGGGR